MSDITDFKVGDFIEGRPDKLEYNMIGYVTGITVNAFGEPILMAHMTVRKFSSPKSMRGLGYEPLPNHGVNEFYTRVGEMHPSNVRPLNRLTVL